MTAHKTWKLFLAIALLSLGSVVNAQIKVHYLNVGQADSILLEFRTAAVLIDAGGESTGDTRDQDHLVKYLHDFFTRRTDLNRTLMSVIISHPHIDHTKSLMAVMQGFTVQTLVDGGNTSGSGIGPLKKARAFAKAHHIRYRVIKDSNIGNEGLTLFPALMNSSHVDLRLLAGSRGCENANNDSLVVLVRYQQASYLFTGDAEADGDSDCEGELPVLMDFYKGTNLLDVDVYKVGHHGSYNGTDAAFMRAMSPKISVISAGIHTQHGPGAFHAFQFGHPREVTVSLLEQISSSRRDPLNVYSMDAVRAVHLNRPLNKAVYCTCWDGDVVVSTNATGSSFNVQTTGR
jgi:competence protein ComEC